MAALVIYVRLHDGRYHGGGDWPPSPARLFQALVAGAGLSGPLEESDKEALRWLHARCNLAGAFFSTCRTTTATPSEANRQRWRRSGLQPRSSSHISSMPKFHSCTRGPWPRTRRINKMQRRFAAWPSASISSDAESTWLGPGAKCSTMEDLKISW